MTPEQARAASYSAGYSPKMTIPDEVPPAPPVSWESQIRADERRNVAIYCQMLIQRAMSKAEACAEIDYQILKVPRPADPTPEGAD